MELLESILDEFNKNNIIVPKYKKAHLAVFDKNTISLIKKNEFIYESRWSSKKSRPYNRINEGDIVFIKESKGPVVGFFIARDIVFYEIDSSLSEILNKYSISFSNNEEYDEYVSRCKYISIMRLSETCLCTPFKVEKRDSQPWVCFK